MFPLVKLRWFKTHTKSELPEKFDFIFQSWDTANRASELSDYSVCTTWGAVRTGPEKGRLYLRYVSRAAGVSRIETRGPRARRAMGSEERADRRQGLGDTALPGADPGSNAWIIPSES